MKNKYLSRSLVPLTKAKRSEETYSSVLIGLEQGLLLLILKGAVIR